MPASSMAKLKPPASGVPTRSFSGASDIAGGAKPDASIATRRSRRANFMRGRNSARTAIADEREGRPEERMRIAIDRLLGSRIDHPRPIDKRKHSLAQRSGASQFLRDRPAAARKDEDRPGGFPQCRNTEVQGHFPIESAGGFREGLRDRSLLRFL